MLFPLGHLRRKQGSSCWLFTTCHHRPCYRLTQCARVLWLSGLTFVELFVPQDQSLPKIQTFPEPWQGSPPRSASMRDRIHTDHRSEVLHMRKATFAGYFTNDWELNKFHMAVSKNCVHYPATSTKPWSKIKRHERQWFTVLGGMSLIPLALPQCPSRTYLLSPSAKKKLWWRGNSCNPGLVVGGGARETACCYIFLIPTVVSLGKIDFPSWREMTLRLLDFKSQLKKKKSWRRYLDY